MADIGICGIHYVDKASLCPVHPFHPVNLPPQDKLDQEKDTTKRTSSLLPSDLTSSQRPPVATTAEPSTEDATPASGTAPPPATPAPTDQPDPAPAPAAATPAQGSEGGSGARAEPGVNPDHLQQVGRGGDGSESGMGIGWDGSVDGGGSGLSVGGVRGWDVSGGQMFGGSGDVWDRLTGGNYGGNRSARDNNM